MKPLEPLSRTGVHRTGSEATCSILEVGSCRVGSATVLQTSKSLFARQALTTCLWGKE